MATTKPKSKSGARKAEEKPAPVPDEPREDATVYVNVCLACRSVSLLADAGEDRRYCWGTPQAGHAVQRTVVVEAKVSAADGDLLRGAMTF